MSTMPNLHRNQVRDSLISWKEAHTLPIPDFATRAKTSFMQSKIYVTVVEGEVHFMELNFFQRMVRWLFGCYQDTILGKNTKDKVVNFIHEVLTQPEFQEMLVLQMQIRSAESKQHLNLIQDALNQLSAKIPPRNNKETDLILLDDLTELQEVVKSKISAGASKVYKDDFLSDKFLDQVLQLAKEHNKTEQSEPIWKAIEEALKLNPDPQKRDLNVALFKELIRVMQGEGVGSAKQSVPDLIAVPCQGVEVSDTIKLTAAEGIESAEQKISRTGGLSSWKDYFGDYLMWVHFNKEMSHLRTIIKKMLQDDKSVMVLKLRSKLLELGAHEVLVTEYLNEGSRLDERLFFHSELSKDEADLAVKSKKGLKAIESAEEAMRDKIEAEYEAMSNGGAGDCFFLSCDQLANSTQGNWRAEIAAHMLKEKSTYLSLVLRRMETDNLAPQGISFEGYCKWIQEQGNWGGEPELKAFAELVKKPVIVVQNVNGRQFEWSASYNLECDEDPLIFLNHGATHYEAMIPKELREMGVY